MANIRFAVSIQRFIPFLGYHHLLMMLLSCGIILSSILVAGCSSYSSVIVDIYILGLSYQDASTYQADDQLDQITRNLSTTLSEYRGNKSLTVRVGYFGICALQRGVIWVCSSDIQGLREQIGLDNDPLDLIGMAAKFRDEVLFPGPLFMVIILGFITFLLLATFPGWHEETDERGSEVDIKPFPSRPVSQIALACVFAGAVLALIASLWQHIGAVGAAAVAESTGYGNIRTSIGAGSMAMGWCTFGLMTVATTGLLVMILSIIVLDKLTDE